MVHISELTTEHVASVESVVSVGDEIEVKVIEIDRMGRVNLSHRAIIEGDDYSPRPSRDTGDRRSGNRDRDRGDDRRRR